MVFIYLKYFLFITDVTIKFKEAKILISWCFYATRIDKTVAIGYILFKFETRVRKIAL